MYSETIQRLARNVEFGILPFRAMKEPASHLSCIVALAGALLLQECGTAPKRPAPPLARGAVPSNVMPGASTGSEITLRAIALRGARYKWGGAWPTSFDYSGLVRYVHGQLGIEMPRKADE